MGRIIKYLKNLYTYLRDGGVVYNTIEYCNPGERLKGKKILVTGGSSGIGLAAAKECLSEGAEVLICARRLAVIEQTLRLLNNVHAHGMVWDVADVKAIQINMGNALGIMGSFDVFVNCAGVSDFAGKTMNEEETYDYITGVNAKGLFFMCKAQSQYFIENKKKGKIINITSACGDIPGFDSYSISKWGANCLTKGLAKTMIEHGVIVNGIAPGEVPTNITAHLQDRLNQDNKYTALHQSKRFTEAKEIARMVVYLSSGESNNIVGQIIKMSGSAARY